MTAQPSPTHFSKAITRDVLEAPRPSWDRGDGYDANDPDAPACFRCWGCDEFRPTETAFCTSCDATSGSYVDDGTVIPFVEIVTARCVERDERLFAILTADRSLTPDEKAYVDRAERNAA